MKKVLRLFLAGAGAALISTSVNAQICEATAELADQHMDGFISDGQSYRALLNDDEVAEFETTLFAGTTYRIAAYGHSDAGNLIFSVVDEENNVLFSSKDFGNASYWDFKVESKIDVRIQAELNREKISSGCAVLLVGFKR